MIYFRKEVDLLIFFYEPSSDTRWVYENLEKDGFVIIRKIFRFKNADLYTNNQRNDEIDDTFDSYESVEFVIGNLVNNYFKINNRTLGLSHNLFIHKNVDLEQKMFITHHDISIFKKIDDLVNGDIYIGGENDNSLPWDEFLKLVDRFPNSYEIKKYAEARISVILRNYFETAVDGEAKYNKYMNKKISHKGDDLISRFMENELNKYITIQNKLNEMLESEDSYNEKQWQKEIIQILLLLFPKYIHVFENVLIRDTYSEKDRFLDYLLIDSSGNTDIVEIKKPFDSCIVTKTQYRDNYIPLKELSGTVMQIEKYIFYLNKWGKRGEEILTKKYKDKLPDNFQIQITNPNGIIIMGRELDLSKGQLQDFEVIKRKYKNIVDIISYDDLLRRLDFTIEQIKMKRI